MAANPRGCKGRIFGPLKKDFFCGFPYMFRKEKEKIKYEQIDAPDLGAEDRTASRRPEVWRG